MLYHTSTNIINILLNTYDMQHVYVILMWCGVISYVMSLIYDMMNEIGLYCHPLAYLTQRCVFDVVSVLRKSEANVASGGHESVNDLLGIIRSSPPPTPHEHAKYVIYI